MRVSQTSSGRYSEVAKGIFYEGPLTEICDFRAGHMVYVRPKDGDVYEVIRPGYRRGPILETEDEAIAQARRMASTVLVLNKYGKIKFEVHVVP